MFLALLAAISIGICIGIITGLVPGLHVNLAAVFLVSISGILLSSFSPLYIGAVIIAMAVTHTFLDIIPSVFLGVPDEETALSVLPGHRLLLRGEGIEAVLLSIFGSLLALVLSLPLVPVLLLVLVPLYTYIEPYIGWILLVACLFLILREKEKTAALVLFSLSGALGIVVLRLPLSQPLLPLLSGLFGVSMLCMSLRQKVHVPPQKHGTISLENTWHAVPSAVILGSCASFLPGLGPAQAAALCSQMIKLGEKGFLILTGGLAAANLVLSIVTLYLLDKARSGAVVALSSIMHISFSDLWLLLCVALIAGGIATVLAIFFSRAFARIIPKIPYTKSSLTVLIFIVFLVFIITGWLGLVVLVVSTAVGIFAYTQPVAKSHMMGCLLVPVMFYFLL